MRTKHTIVTIIATLLCSLVFEAPVANAEFTTVVDCFGCAAGDAQCAATCQGAVAAAKVSSTASTGVVDSTVVAACQTKVAAAIQACSTSLQSASSDCDDSQNSGLSQAKQVATALGSATSTSVAAACSNMAKVSEVMNAAIGAYELSCSSSVESCGSACATALSTYNSCVSSGYVNASAKTAITENQKTCSGLSQKAAAAQTALTNAVQTAIAAKNCSSLTSGSTLSTDFTSSVVDCTNTEMASNTVCICAANPNATACLNTTSANSATLASTSAASRLSTSSDSLGDLYGTGDIAQGTMPNITDGAAVDGKQGNGAMLSNSPDGAAAATAKKAGLTTNTDTLDVNAGFYGGGNGGGFSATSASGGGTISLEDAKAAKGAGQPDLRQFLPGGAIGPQSRGLAGVSGPDGITGPNSDIWQKIQNRYKVIQPSLIP